MRMLAMSQGCRAHRLIDMKGLVTTFDLAGDRGLLRRRMHSAADKGGGGWLMMLETPLLVDGMPLPSG